MYIQGYIVAMAAIPSLKFYYETEADFQIIKTCKFGDFAKILSEKQKIVDIIKQRMGEEQSSKLLKTIDDYFGNSTDEN